MSLFPLPLIFTPRLRARCLPLPCLLGATLVVSVEARDATDALLAGTVTGTVVGAVVDARGALDVKSAILTNGLGWVT